MRAMSGRVHQIVSAVRHFRVHKFADRNGRDRIVRNLYDQRRRFHFFEIVAVVGVKRRFGKTAGDLRIGRAETLLRVPRRVPVGLRFS